MFNKLVVFNVLCSKIPCEIKINSCNNKLIKKTILKAKKSKFCVCANCCFLKVIAKYKNLIYFKTIYLNGLTCQNVFLNFSFSTKLYKSQTNLITLRDANYGIPVKRALLNFKHKIINNI